MNSKNFHWLQFIHISNENPQHNWSGNDCNYIKGNFVPANNQVVKLSHKTTSYDNYYQFIAPDGREWLVGKASKNICLYKNYPYMEELLEELQSIIV